MLNAQIFVTDFAMYITCLTWNTIMFEFMKLGLMLELIMHKIQSYLMLILLYFWPLIVLLRPSLNHLKSFLLIASNYVYLFGRQKMANEVARLVCMESRSSSEMTLALSLTVELKYSWIHFLTIFCRTQLCVLLRLNDFWIAQFANILNCFLSSVASRT
jgi:hypothetical protein